MKDILLFALVLIATPAWAGDAVVSPPAVTSTTAVTVQLKGSAKQINTLLTAFKDDALYQTADCKINTAAESPKSAHITCMRADSTLMSFLINHSPANMFWKISSIRGIKVLPAICPITPCSRMACPPPNGTVRCCTRVRPGVYQACDSGCCT